MTRSAGRQDPLQKRQKQIGSERMPLKRTQTLQRRGRESRAVHDPLGGRLRKAVQRTRERGWTYPRKRQQLCLRHDGPTLGKGEVFVSAARVETEGVTIRGTCTECRAICSLLSSLFVDLQNLFREQVVEPACLINTIQNLNAMSSSCNSSLQITL